MDPKPNPKIAEPSAGYADALERAVDPGIAPLTAGQQGFLREVMVDFEELEEEAKEKDLPPPAPAAKKAALAFLHAVVREVPRPYAAGMCDGGAVVVCAQGAKGFRVDVYFEADGDAMCFVTRPSLEQSEERDFSPAEEVACEWVFDALRKLGK